MFARYAGYSAFDFKPPGIILYCVLVKLTDLMNLANILHSLTHEPRKAKDPTLSYISCVHNYIVPVIQLLK